MAEPQFSDIGACVFDAYGTLFDFNSAVRRSADSLGDKADALSEVWRAKQVQYTWLRSLMGRFDDFFQVTGEALDFAMQAVGIGTDPALRAALMQHYLMLDAFPEVADTLETLRKAKIRTAILSNGTESMLVGAAKSSGLSKLIDVILSVDRVQIYKPHPSVYQLAVDELKVPADRIAFMSANGWDAAGAAAFGFRVAWINRAGQPRETLPAVPAAELDSLARLPEILGL